MDQQPKGQPVSAFDLFSKSTEAVKRNLKAFVVLNILPFVLGLSAVFDDERNNNWSGFGGLSGLPTEAVIGWISVGLLVFLVIIAASFILQVMHTALELDGAKGKTVSLQHLWQLAKKYWLRLFGLWVVIGLLVVGGLILLIVPGLIVLRRYFLASYILIDQDTTIGEAMRRSAELSKPYSGAVWGVIGVTILIGLIGIIPVIGWIVSFVLGVIYSVAPALRYEELKKLAPQEHPAPET